MKELNNTTRLAVDIVCGVCGWKAIKNVWGKVSMLQNYHGLSSIGANIIFPSFGFITGFETADYVCNTIQGLQKAFKENSVYNDVVKDTEDSQN